PEFGIAAESPEPMMLPRGTSEWWTEQALEERTVRDILEEAMENAQESLVTPRPEPQADRPASNAVLAPPVLRPPPAHNEPAARLAQSADASSASSLSSPLRL